MYNKVLNAQSTSGFTSAEMSTSLGVAVISNKIRVMMSFIGVLLRLRRDMNP
jgi:hypothetical protein